jgi:tetratricopeptide (TPR) repeat protein
MSASQRPGLPAPAAGPRLPLCLLPLCLSLLPCLPGCLAYVDERVPQFTEDGVQLYQRGDYPHARECFEMALQLHPGDANLMYNVAECHDREGNTGKAEEMYRLCLDRSANHARCRHSLALLLYRTGEAKKARQMIEDWVAAEPQSPDALIEDGWRLRQGGELHQALARYQQALHHDPNHVRALTELGLLYEQQQQPERALYLYERALARDPRQPELLEHVRVLKGRGVGKPLPD